MRFLAGLWRLAIAALCFVGTYQAWQTPSRWTYFSFQAGFLLGLVMLWAGAASLLKGIQPPAWLKGCLTVYAILTLLASLLLMPADKQQSLPLVWGIMATTVLCYVVPIMTLTDFLLCDPHRRFKWHYTFSWLVYLPAYLAFVVIRAQLWPHSGPAAGGSPYPYAFIDLPALGWIQFGINVFELLAVCAGLGLVAFLIDHILPAKPLLGRVR
ncbi:hypothetical protein CRD60_06535 [Bifidobacterium aemilianum]|uniref:Uncharacterized protein n=1 Tax=Bifidobacterium aemilianum TaxID=2493120 RepID=A0A366KA01_9BIFI|nr:Pr6Pr family membrane protein [Bifidobacterium aemilianum]RBP97491.1 hypothetical protein CRD60_06535 [Bifidobacterium aemilianum]